MRHLLKSLVMVFGVAFSASAQLADGSIAPDFTLTDRDGTTHNLYQYLDEGKAVFIEFFACHCPSCWAYHNTGTLEQLNQMYGPTGTDQVVVLMIEHDENNGDNEFSGTGGWTQGDWETGNSVPMINAEGADRAIFNEYDMVYFTLIYKICPDKTTQVMSTGLTSEQLYLAADACPGTLSIEETLEEGDLYIDQVNNVISLENFGEIHEFTLLNTAGQTKLTSQEKTLNISELEQGVYLVKVVHSKGIFTKKIWLH